MNDKPKTQKKQDPPPVPILGLFLTLFWVLAGNCSLIYIAYSIGFRKNIEPARYAILYVLNILALMAARYLDIRFYQGNTTEGEPATLEHWMAYTRKLFIIAFLLLIVVFLVRVFIVI
ncbi:MAG: hypothetical protein V1913_01300 [Fibrobacterota bacterium]